MAGHSKFKNIQFRKSAQDKKRAGLFGKLAREITAAARSTADVENNPRLRSAIANARACNMPNDNIERAIRRSRDGDAAQYESIRYEGFAAGGVGVIVEALSDNRNRTAGEIRAIFSKGGGNLGERGSVAFLFEHVGAVFYPAAALAGEDMLDAAIEAGASDCEMEEEQCGFFCPAEALHAVAAALEARFGTPDAARLVWRPNVSVAVGGEDAAALLRLLDALEDNDDVQQVYANFDMTDEVAEEIMTPVSAHG